MSHLTLETLARLVDEAPNAGESAHLETCKDCRRELDALREQTVALSELPRLAPSSDAWPDLRRRLREEGLSRRRMRLSPGVLRAAAAVALLIAGGASGWTLRGLGAAETTMAAGADGPAPAATETRLADGSASGQQPSMGAVTGAADRTAGEAAGNLSNAQFEAALEEYMVQNTGPASDPAARLAALDNIVLTTAEALNESPADPVINGYHKMAQAQRQAVLRQIATTATEPVF